MYPHLMTLEDILRSSYSCTEFDKATMFDRLLEIALEQEIELEWFTEECFELGDKVTKLEKKVSYLEESIEEQENAL